MTQHDCSHENTGHEFQERIFEGEVFKYKTLVCKDCGSNLWDSKIELRFNKWLNELYESQNRNMFQVQFQFSENGLKCIDKLLEEFPGVERSHLMRALITVYLDIVMIDDSFLQFVDDMENSSAYIKLKADEKIKCKLQFKPKALMEIHSVSEMTGDKNGRVVEDILNRMVSLCIQTNPILKKYWEELIFKNLEIILKAA